MDAIARAAWHRRHIAWAFAAVAPAFDFYTGVEKVHEVDRQLDVVGT
jgi:hypothetical protein